MREGSEEVGVHVEQRYLDPWCDERDVFAVRTPCRRDRVPDAKPAEIRTVPPDQAQIGG